MGGLLLLGPRHTLSEVPVNCTPREPHTWQQCLLLASSLKAGREKAGPMWVAELARMHLDKVI